MRKGIILFVIIACLVFGMKGLAIPEEGRQQQAEKYRHIQEEMLAKPDLVTPDSILTSYGLKSIYYQNIQIIQLLEDIKGLLKDQIKQQQIIQKQKEEEKK